MFSGDGETSVIYFLLVAAFAIGGIGGILVWLLLVDWSILKQYLERDRP